MRYTENYRLPQIELEDNYDIEHFNDGWRKTDEELKRLDVEVQKRVNYDDTEIRELINETNTSLDNNITELTKIKDRVVNENLTKYRFIATSFNQTEMKLVNMYSNDGSIWYAPNPSGDFTSTTGNGTLRDPSMMQWGDWYYICYTKIAWGTGNTVGYCRTKNFIEYEEFSDIAIGNFNKLWAPEFFRDYKTHKTYLVFSGSTDLQTDNFRGYLQEISFLSSGEMTKIKEPIKLTGCCDINAIDFSIYQDTYKYYLVYKNETNKTMNFAQCPNINGDYTLINGDLFAETEGAQIVKTESGYRVYYDNYTSNMLSYRDTYDSFVTFTDKVDLGYPNGFQGRHMFVFDTCKVASTEINLKPYCIAKNNIGIAINNNVDTIVPLNEIIVRNDMETTETEIIIPSGGAYLVTLSLAWIENPTGYRLIGLEHNGNAFAISQVQAVQGGQTAQNVSSLIYARAGDKIRITVKQTSGGTLNLVPWSHSVVLTCNRI
ncbi:MAG: hypothetical protein J6D12_01640 [Peptostreptococcaceae bacterium]|nr:hypothetical protein [Peptostreptococcaceae bacterium]